MDSEVYWPPKPSTQPLCQVESADVIKNSLDPFGSVSSGFIRVKGCTREGWVGNSGLYQDKQSQNFLGCAWLDYRSEEAQAVVCLQLFEECLAPLHRFYRVLLLVPCTQSPQTFRRVGVARIDWDLSPNLFDDSPEQALTIV